MDRHFILATAGHVDHGKSALVQALTSTDPDRLPEEKQRGITIDLGFAALQLDSKSEPGASLRIGVIDVPGHEDFVKNMVAGVGCVNLGLIVVAADDGWMPQTEEHLQILEYLRVPKVVVALNKIDLAPDDQEFLEEVIRDELKGSSFADAPIVATSTVSGQGIDDLRRRVTEQCEALESPVDTGRPRLSVDRTFVVKGHGTVVTGTLTGGCLEEGQAVVVQPSGLESRVRGLQSFGEAVNKAHPGSRVAVNLASLSVKRSGEASQEGVTRGDVVVASGMELGGQIIDCVIEKSHRLHERKIPAAKPLKHGLRVRVHHGSDNVPGRLFFLDQDALVVGETSPAQMRVEQSIALLPGDRFVIRDWAEMHTLAGGVVVNTPSDSRGFRSPASRRFFATCGAKGDPVEQLMLAIIERESNHRGVNPACFQLLLAGGRWAVN